MFKKAQLYPAQWWVVWSAFDRGSHTLHLWWTICHLSRDWRLLKLSRDDSPTENRVAHLNISRQDCGLSWQTSLQGKCKQPFTRTNCNHTRTRHKTFIGDSNDDAEDKQGSHVQYCFLFTNTTSPGRWLCNAIFFMSQTHITLNFSSQRNAAPRLYIYSYGIIMFSLCNI